MLNTARTLAKRRDLALSTLLALCVACASPAGTTPLEQRASVAAMHDEVLSEIYALDPAIQAEVENAPGYGTFFNSKFTLFVATGGSGYGVVANNDTGARTYMRMGQAGVALGAGFSEFKALFVFHDTATLERFVTSGWEFGGSADATAKDGDKGGDATASGDVNEGLTVYRITETGLSAQVSATGTKYWTDDALNEITAPQPSAAPQG